MLLRAPAFLALLLLAACAAPERTAAPPDVEPTADAPDVGASEAAESDPAPDPLYILTEDQLRLAFTDGLFGLYRAEVDPAQAERLDAAGVDAWLTDLALVSPRSAAFTREALGPVLDQPYLVGFVLEDAAVADCASIRDVLYIPVPERFQDAFTGFIAQDACDVAAGDFARFCSGGFGSTDDGAACSCTCSIGEAPGLGCVSCGEN